MHDSKVYTQPNCHCGQKASDRASPAGLVVKAQRAPLQWPEFSSQVEPYHSSVSSHAVAAAHIEEPEELTTTYNYVLGLWGGKGRNKGGRLATDVSLG